MIGRRSQEHPPEPRPVSTLAGVLWQEFSVIHDKARVPVGGQDPDTSLQAYLAAALEHEQAALCLSGGGIRSAAFSLGVLQALARLKLLTGFHYLSLVSGGSYIGGWLTALLHEHGGDAAKVQDLLGADEAPPELHQLRHYTNFLAPRPGVASPDTWTGIVLWIRNVLVNWMIFLPALFALALLPGLYTGLLTAVGPGWSWPLLLIALLGLGLGVYDGAQRLPSRTAAETIPPEREAGLVRWGVVLPLMLWSTLVPLVAAPWLRQVMPEDAVLGDVIPPLGFVVMELAYLIATLRAGDDDRRMFWRNFPWWTLAALIASGVLWLALDLAIGVDMRIVAVLGPLVVTLAHLVLSLVYVALRPEAFRDDLDREWLARLSGEKVIPALLWAVFAAVCLWLPVLVFDRASATLSLLTSTFGVLTGPLAAYLGKTATSGSDGGKPGGGLMPSMTLIINIFAAVFAAALFMLLARLGAVLSADRWPGYLVLLVIAVPLALALGKRINVNRFSMHAVYRTRLVRAFLGSARRQRAPEGFTGIDPHDNPRMTDMAAHDGTARRLFPVVNVTLNLSASRNTAWTERKGESFSITPIGCGAAFLHRQEDAAAGLPARGAYVPTAKYAGNEKEIGPRDPGRGLTLGTAITLSGAAASPNMGYRTSPATAFLMTLFNVRLGAWLPNPARASARELSRAKPPNALVTLTRELLGLSSDRGGAVYLSDGGHFENLGLYEMVRRRCRYIVVVDASANSQTAFEDLGNAVRKIRIDLDVDIKFDPPVGIGSRTAPLKPFRCFAYGRIHYPNSSIEGELLYLKSADMPDTPMDVRAYRNLNALFPHQPTSDEFYSESQFESYRRLGQSEAEAMALQADTIAGFFRDARQSLLGIATPAAGAPPDPPRPRNVPRPRRARGGGE